MSYERPYYKNLNYHPLLFYVIFGVRDEELKVSKEKHNVDSFPDGLDFVFCNRKDNNSYMQSLTGGKLGEILDREKHNLYEKIKNTDKWAIISGEVQQDDNLDYMRNTIGFVQALLERGAIGVLDLQTFSLYSPEDADFNNTYYQIQWNQCKHW